MTLTEFSAMKSTHLILALFAAGLAWANLAQAQTTWLSAAHMIDPIKGKRIDNPLIRIEDGKVVSVGDADDLPTGEKVIDLGNKTLLPGLADLHTHLTRYASDQGFKFVLVSPSDEAIRGVVNARKTLMAGFTVARNLGATSFADVALRNAINDGQVPGPRLQVSGPSLGITGGHCDTSLLPKNVDYTLSGVADGPWAVREKVRENAKYGVDVIKFCATGGVLSKGTEVGARQYTLEEMEAIVDEAHTRGMKAAAHAHGAEGIRYAIRAGVDSIEHSSLIDDEGIELALENDTVLSMNIYATEYVLAEGEKNGVLPESMAKARFVHERRRANFAKVYKAGATLVYSTDSAVIPHGANGRQFSRMVGLGMKPIEAIQAATTVAADVLGWAGQTGAIAPGYFADIIAVEGDPLKDISVLENVSFVMKEGIVYKNQ